MHGPGMNHRPAAPVTLRFCAAGGLICINAVAGGSGSFGRGAIDPESAQQPRSAVMAHKRVLSRSVGPVRPSMAAKPGDAVHIALENAVSVASVLLLTEATMTRLPEPNGEQAGLPAEP